MKRKIVVLTVIVILAFAACAFAQYVPEVLRVKGDPQIMKKGADTWASCKEKTAVEDGDRIKTSKDEVVVIGFVENRKNIIRVGGDSEVVMIDGLEPSYIVELLNGEALALLLSLPQDSNFEVRTPAGVSSARGTGWRALTDGETATFEAYDNSIYVKGVYADGKPMEYGIFVNMGYKTVVKKLEQPAPVQRLTPEDIDRWNAWRDEVKYIQLRLTASGGTEKIDDLIRKK
jgi:hypothetical protein